MPPDSAPAFLSAHRRILLFGGKGGVGKTTCAAATAVVRASAGERVLLLSTDPAHSVPDILPDARPDTLRVEELDADAATEAFRDAHRDTLHEIVSLGTLFAESDVAALLDLSLPGMDEIMAFLRLSDLLAPPDSSDDPSAARTGAPPSSAAAVRATDVDVVIVDTAPTGHTLRLLDAPGRFLQWLDVLDVLLGKHRYMRSVFGGSRGPDRYDAFLDAMRERAERVHAALSNPATTQFVVVTRAEAVVHDETRRLLRDLKRRRIPVPEVVVNAFPAESASEQIPHGGSEVAQDEHETFRGVDLWAVPEYGNALDAPASSALASFWDSATRIKVGRVRRSLRRVGESGAPEVEDPAPLPEAQLLLVAGKGGVGKTTVAAATALRLASDATGRQRRVLVASTDPAHSLLDVLGLRSSQMEGDQREDDASSNTGGVASPIEVAPGLDAVEIDAQGKFDRLREAYASEVRQFFETAGGSSLDLPYDRPVAESLMDLAPPGIDEVMGWLSVMEFLDGDTYHTCVVDPAPTGHFVRLLEMPGLFAEWIRAFFRILRNHRDVLRLPELTDRLVRLSKQVRRWNELFSEGTASAIGVALPRRAVLAETRDLNEAVRSHKATLSVLVVNRVTPTESRSSEEATVIEAYRSAFPNAAVPLVHDGPQPGTVRALRTLGRRLYRS